MIDVKPMPHPGAYEVHISGRVTEDDYEKVLIPALDRAIEEYERIRVLAILMDAEFSVGAMLDDADVGLRHWTGFDRCAVVVEPGWLSRLVRGFGPLMPCPVGVFRPGEEDDARRWLVESLGAIHQTDLGDGVLHVALRGKLDAAVYEEEQRDMDAFLRREDHPRFLIDLTDFDGWQGLAALPRHLSVMRTHMHAPGKVAIVGNAAWQRLGERVLGQLRGETKFFKGEEIDAAKAWLADA